PRLRRPARKQPYHKYNSTLGAASQELAGPFEYPSTTIRVLPLLADRTRLERMCAQHLDTDVVQCKPYGTYVYLIIQNVDEAISRSGNIGGWGFRQVSFAVPVKSYQRGTGELINVSMVMPFVFIDNSIAANTFSEVLGLEAEEAEIRSPSTNWLDDAGPAEATTRQLVDVVARVFPALGSGQQAVQRSVVEALYGDILPYNDDVHWRFVAEDWGRTLRDEYQRKVDLAGRHLGKLRDGTALALELLVNRVPLSIATVKQFRSAERPDEACYQSIVQLSQRIEQVYDMREIERLIHVKVRNYPSLPIVETLGLKPKWISVEDCDEVYNLQPVRPFWLKVALSQNLGYKVAERAGSMNWHVPAGAGIHDEPYLVRAELPKVGRSLLDRLDLRSNLTYYRPPSDGCETEATHKGLLVETMNVLGRLVDMLSRGSARANYVISAAVANSMAALDRTDTDDTGGDTGELVEALDKLLVALKSLGSAGMRALAAEIA
ncbi:MAG: hypothetical protein AAGC55_26830, partial [Myxococcota bacterium]